MVEEVVIEMVVSQGGKKIKHRETIVTHGCGWMNDDPRWAWFVMKFTYGKALKKFKKEE